MPQSPWQGAAITRKKAAADFPVFPVDTLDETLVVHPFKYQVAAGVLSASGRQDCTATRIVHSAAGTQFINAPDSPSSVYAFCNRSNATAMAITNSRVANAPNGFFRRFTMTTGGTPTIGMSGFIAQAKQRQGAKLGGVGIPNITNGSAPAPTDFAAGRTLSERVSHPARSYISGLAIFSVRFKVDASQQPTAVSSLGWPNFFVTKTGTGTYSMTLGVELPPNAIIVPSCDSRGVSTTHTGNTVSISTFNGAVATDPVTGSEIVLLFFVPKTVVARNQMNQNNTTDPVLGTAFREYPLLSFTKDAVFIPIVLAIDGSGNITATGSVIPDGIKVLRNGTAYYVECGAGLTSLAAAAFQPSTAAVGLPVDYTNFQTQGRILFTGTLTSCSVYGWILASRTKVQ